MDKHQEFVQAVWDYYREHGRDLPWRQEPFDVYSILVSEVMLQQTQVSRVIPKYVNFLGQFPSIQALVEANLSEVLRAWSGLGYNRRAKYLYDAAKNLKDTAVWAVADLTSCKGIGYNTAAAVVVYAYGQPLSFIETNIRTVYIHHFFPDTDSVCDADIMPIIEATLDHEHPRNGTGR